MRAALELFAEQGYENTTVVEIAERAGLTKSTFFRHVPDKREVLFIGQDFLVRALTDGIASAPDGAAPLEAVAAALDAAAEAFPPERREFGPRRQAVIAANPELQEREALKRTGFAAAMTEALRARGTTTSRRVWRPRSACLRSVAPTRGGPIRQTSRSSPTGPRGADRTAGRGRRAIARGP